MRNRMVVGGVPAGFAERLAPKRPGLQAPSRYVYVEDACIAEGLRLGPVSGFRGVIGEVRYGYGRTIERQRPRPPP